MFLSKTAPACATAPGVLGRLGIGTVQFGQAYGVSNAVGQVPRADVKLILEMAALCGIRLLDTAANYGEAESVLGGTNLKPFRIVSKTIGVQHGVHAVIARVRQSVRTLGAVDLLLVHAAKDLSGHSGTTLWRSLQALKAEGVIGAVGISAYVADDPVMLAERFRPDAMQLPFSLLDQRLLADGSLDRLKQLGVEIHARSLFLQGLLFMAEPPQSSTPRGRCWRRCAPGSRVPAPRRSRRRWVSCCRGRKSMSRWWASRVLRSSGKMSRLPCRLCRKRIGPLAP